MSPTPRIDIAKFNEYVEKKLINRQEHPKGGLYIWNYTPIAQYTRTWDEVTLQARGLITDLEGNIVARPFTKFFNYEEHQEALPDEPFKVHEKLDGSLGIMYPEDGALKIATRGSFLSDQAIKATHLLKQYNAQNGTDWVLPGYTYLFEIIYPANRIVVDYGTTERLVLLAAINTETGDEMDIQAIDYPDKAQPWYGAHNLEELRAVTSDNAEGFVIHFDSGLRLKMKQADYVRLHRILTNVSSKNIWESLRSNTSMNEMLDRVPDEFYKWVETTVGVLMYNHDILLGEAMGLASKFKDMERKEVALELQKHDAKLRPLVFQLLDGKQEQANDTAWKFVKPTYEKPFKEDIDA